MAGHVLLRTVRAGGGLAILCRRKGREKATAKIKV